MKISINLLDMMHRLNVDAGLSYELFMPLLERAAKTCSSCRERGICKAWGEGSGASEDWRSFCSNAQLIECLPKRREQYGEYSCSPRGP